MSATTPSSADFVRLLSSLPSQVPRHVLWLAAQAHAAPVRRACNGMDWGITEELPTMTPNGVEQALQSVRPGVVVCAPEVFGWVSKAAFLAGAWAVYTCGPDGEGTLWHRATATC